jgi:hypothetical protein
MERLKPWQKTAIVGAAYALLVVIMTWPSISALGQRLIGDNEDAWIFFWNNWWLREALSGDLNLFFTPHLFFPQGTSLVAHSNSHLSSILAIFIDPLVGPVASYNLVLLFGLWVGAMGTFLLVKDITKYLPAAFIAGFVFAFAPYHVSRVLAHANLGSIHWWPFFALFLRRTLYKGRWRDAILAGVFGALTVWSGLQLAVLLVLWAVLYLLWFIWIQRSELFGDKGLRNRFLSRCAVILLVAFLLSLPLLYGLVTNWSDVVGSASFLDESRYKQTDILAYVTPSPDNPLWGDLVNSIYDKFPYHRGFKPFIGFTVIALVAAAAWGWRKKAGFWLISSGLWILLAAGPVLRVNGELYDKLPLPYRWLGSIFPISTIRASDRFNLLLVMSMAVLVGMGIAYLARFRYWRWALAAVGLLLFIEYLFIPMPSMEIPEISQFLEDIADDEGDYAVVDYPLSYTLAKQWLYFQTIHEKSTVDGHVSRYTSETYDYLANQPILNSLYDGGEVPRNLPGGFFDETRETPITSLGPAIRDLQESGIRYVMVHLPYTSEERMQHIESILPLVPAYQDDLLIVYDLSRPKLHSFEPFPIALSPDMDLVQVITRMNDGGAELEIELLVQMMSSSAQEVECQAVLAGTPISSSFDLFQSGVEWKQNDLARVTVNLPVPSDLQAGRYSWQLQCPEGAPVVSRESLFVEGEYRALLGQDLQLIYEDLIELESYRYWFEGGDLHLALQWKALSDMSQDYKVFIHLLDQSGNIASQNDFVHCNGGCPTSQWTPGQRIVDESNLTLSDLPPGEYSLALGLYNGDTGLRLETRDNFGQVIPEAYFVLNETIKINEDRLIWP